MPSASVIERKILALLQGRTTTICPSDVARALRSERWRALMPAVREVACDLAARGRIEITQRGRRVEPPFRGPIRLGLARDR